MERRCADATSTVIAISFSSGTVTLAKNTSSASGHEPLVHRKMTPLMIVSSCDDSSVLVFMIGSTFAGMYRMYAAISSAHVRARLFGLRTCSVAAQRGQ